MFDMKIPVRPAPLPPNSNRNMSLNYSTSTLDSWDDGPSSLHLSRLPGAKKKPPPRPPPPKFAQNNQRKQVHTRPAPLLSGLFTRNASSRTTHSQCSILTQQKSLQKESQATVATAPLIDFHSPSCSPTPTTRSSSDGLSVNSFGSDGSVSNGGQTPYGGSSSQFESGFEDDFDFFGGLSSSSSFGTAVDEQKDPWSLVKPQDPFSPPRQQNVSVASASVQQVVGSSAFYRQSSDSLSGAVRPSTITSLPTIIRARPGRHPTLPKLSEASGDQSLIPFEARSKDPSNLVPNGDSDDDIGNWSPPMPSIPPPPPPPEALQELEFDGPSPELPPRPVQLQVERFQKPYGIALYDYPATHPDDLSFEANDTIFILRQINSDWLYGQVGQNQGMFPTSFIKVIVPLNDTRGSANQQSQQTVRALYSFAAETWEDLELQEGASVYVISRINDDWLYGESNGKYGQFPASFVDHIPSILPQHTN
ncbi:SH3 domain-containing protein 19 isoform X3 [Cryptotermes secundus]|uniref:SH3 domain-containing protein 19 isoform X3 n=1 Tax=Cryptotermes secundus TaxID=105785 RepID=UPI000CD7C90F|nr:SH3 domain-containing protein 19 isoform X3 [Cryptotermes secundus]